MAIYLSRAKMKLNDEKTIEVFCQNANIRVKTHNNITQKKRKEEKNIQVSHDNGDIVIERKEQVQTVKKYSSLSAGCRY
jgi:phosphoribosylformylglycinamidine (FGAM) synthase-like amidotransferase family enzyme